MIGREMDAFTAWKASCGGFADAAEVGDAVCPGDMIPLFTSSRMVSIVTFLLLEVVSDIVVDGVEDASMKDCNSEQGETEGDS